VIAEVVLAAVVSAVAAAVVAGLTNAGRTALRGVVRLVVDRLGRTQTSHGVLGAVHDASSAPGLTRGTSAGGALLAAGPRVSVQVGGLSVQTGAVHGGLHIHHGGGPAAVAVPRQLPRRPPRWVDRDRQLADLDAALAGVEAGPVVALLTGVGGVGKTALAVWWAHRLGGNFPDGHLYVDLRGAGPGGPLPAADALGRLLRAMGVAPERVPVDVDEQAGLWRSVTTGRRLLILLDNACSAGQVRPLLPAAPGCVVVVTARTRLEGLIVDGARVISVAPLNEVSAVALLRQAAGAGRSAADLAAMPALAQLCAGMPLALAVVAAHLVSHPHQPVAGLADALTAEHQRLARLSIGDHSVTTALDTAYQQLPDPAARAYRLVIGVHPGATFAGDVAAAVLDLPDRQSEVILDDLVRANLLTRPDADGYRYHDLVGVHARQRAASDPERDHARRRMLTWYLAVTRTADEILTPYRHRTPAADLPPDPAGFAGDRDRALDWLEHQRPNLVAVVRDCAADMPYLVYLLADSMWPLFHYHRHHYDRAVVDDIAVDCARRLGDTGFEAAMLRRQGYGHYDTGMFEAARNLFTDSLRLAEHHDDLDHVVLGAVAGLGLVALAQHRLSDAVAHFSRELEVATAAGGARATGMALWHLSQAHRLAGHPTDAVEHLIHAVAAFASLGDTDRYNTALVRVELGRALADTGQPDQAATQIHHALTETTHLRAPRGQANALHALGELAITGGHLTQATRHLTAAQQLYDTLGDAEAADVAHLLTTLEPEGGTRR
jgi:tetratricopeptide (TPR) repeat protein